MNKRTFKILCGAVLSVGLVSTSFAQPARPTETTGLATLTDDRLLSELASRGFDSLLDRAFVVNKTPDGQRDSMRTLVALRDLTNPALSPSQRQQRVDQIVKGIDAAVAQIKDPASLNEQANTLIAYVSERDVNTLEYWGENPRTQASLRPVSESIVKMLGASSALATAQADEIANQLNNPNSPLVDKWMKINELAVVTEFSRYMSHYFVALSMDRADPKRKTVAQEAIDYLKQHDNADSQLQATVRNRTAKLLMTQGKYDDAVKLFDTVINNARASEKDKIVPEPNVNHVYEARYFSTASEIDSGKTEPARKRLDELIAWQKTNMPAAGQQAIGAASTLLNYRLLTKQSELATSDPVRKKADADATAVLLQLVKEFPAFKGVVFEQLSSKVNEGADFKTMDQLLLAAIIQRGETELRRSGEAKPDVKDLERAINAAREMVSRKGKPGSDAQLVDGGALLLPFFLQKLDRQADAVDAFLTYVENFIDNKASAQLAMDNAQAEIAKMRAAKIDDARLTDRFLKLAIDKFARKEFAFEYARRLQLTRQYTDAVKYFDMVEKDNPAFLQARFLQMVSVKQGLDEETGKLSEAERQKRFSRVQTLADEVNKAATSAMNAASDEQEKLRFKSMLVRTSLLAADMARREQKDAKRTLTLLTGFEQSVAGLPNDKSLLGEALYLRVQSYMQLGQSADATRELVKYLDTVQGGQGAQIVFNLLTKVNEELTTAQELKDTPRIRQLARDRAVLSGFLVDWASTNKNPDIQKQTYTYRRFDAASKQLAASTDDNPAQRKAGLEQARQLYQELRNDANVAAYRATIDPAGRVNPNDPDPQVLLGLGLVNYDLADWNGVRENLGPLIFGRKLGTPTMEVERDGQLTLVDNEQFWEARFKLIKANAELGKLDANIDITSTKSDLARLFTTWGLQGVGGKRWNARFNELRTELIPDVKFDDITQPVGEPVEPVAG